MDSYPGFLHQHMKERGKSQQGRVRCSAAGSDTRQCKTPSLTDELLNPGGKME